MRRFPPRDQPPRDRPPRRDLPRPEGPFDRLLRARTQRDPAPFIIGGTVVFLAVVILVVVLVSGIFGGGDGGGTSGGDDIGIGADPGDMPALPPGLVALSGFFEFDAEEGARAQISLQLRSQPEDETGVGFYTYNEGRWQRVADASIENDGKLAVADFDPLPANLAVLRVVAQAYQVAASIPAGGSLHADAQAAIVSPRDYTPLGDGAIEGTVTELDLAEDVLLIPTIVGSGGDTAAVVDDILADESLRAAHLEAIVELAAGGAFDGVDLEYSFVDSDLGDEFSEFVEDLGAALRDDGRRLSLTLPPPGEQRQAYDWKAIGEAADIVKILPIADPLEYWEAMPDAFDQLVKDVDPRKLMLVVSPFSSEISDGESRSLGYLEAMLLASDIRVREPADADDIETEVGVKVVAVNLDESEGATDIEWSDDAAALAFSYGTPGRRTVYIENVFSVGFKLEIAQAYALGGIAIADASARTDVANIWPAINQLLANGTVDLVRPNGDALVPRWEAPDGGKFDAAAGTTVVWRAEEAGDFILRMLLSDGDQRFGRDLTVKVKRAASIGLTPLVTFPPEEEATPTPTIVPTPTPTPDAVAPAKITGVSIDDSEDGQFTISWNPSAAPDLEKYRIYATSQADADFPDEYELVAEVPEGTDTYLDNEFTCPDDDGIPYYYVITAVDASGNESPASSVQSGSLNCP